jgi:hypothetical protein
MQEQATESASVPNDAIVFEWKCIVPLFNWRAIKAAGHCKARQDLPCLTTGAVIVGSVPALMQLQPH